jgi:hypothetical protein
MEAALPRTTPIRLAYAALAALLLGAIVLHGTADWWQLAVFGVAPDIALFYGIGTGLQRGQLHPRAVPLYNLLHRYWLPLGLAFFLPAAALAWALHISIDRAVGYGLRSRDGFQRS